MIRTTTRRGDLLFCKIQVRSMTTYFLLKLSRILHLIVKKRNRDSQFSLTSNCWNKLTYTWEDLKRDAQIWNCRGKWEIRLMKKVIIWIYHLKIAKTLHTVLMIQTANLIVLLTEDQKRVLCTLNYLCRNSWIKNKINKQKIAIIQVTSFNNSL